MDDDGARDLESTEKSGRAARAGAWLKRSWHRAEARSKWIHSAAEAGRGIKRDDLNLSAAYFAYNSFLALFPLLLLIASVLGFVLASNPTLRQNIMNDILQRFPGATGSLTGLVNSVIANRALVGVIGFIGLIWAGMRIPNGLEIGFNHIWKAAKRPFLKRRLLALLVLALFGVLGAVSVGANLFSAALLSWTDKHHTGLGILVILLGIILSLLTNFLLFFMVYRVIPQRRLPSGAIARGAAAAAVLFWLSEYVFNYYFVSVSKIQVLYGTIGAILGLLIWLDFLGYIIFFSAELIAQRTRGLRGDAESNIKGLTPSITEES
jgi:membrane protein